jgi:hypothetical protein
MSISEFKTMLARLFALAALGCGIAAVALPFFEGRVWKLGVLGWFTGGVLLALLAIFLVLDEYAESRRQ